MSLLCKAEFAFFYQLAEEQISPLFQRQTDILGQLCFCVQFGKKIIPILVEKEAGAEEKNRNR